MPGAGRTSAPSRLVVPIVVGALFVLVAVLGGLIWVRYARILAERGAAAKSERPPVSVVVLALDSRTFVDEVNLPGVVEPWDDVWVAAQVVGTVVGVSVEEGDTVTEGAPLCRIDDRDYVAALDGVNAARDAAKSALGLAELQFERMAKLRRDGTVGQAEYDAAEAAVRQAEASFRQTAAAVARATLALERTVVRAPISGFVSKRPAALGALLSPGARVARLVDTRKVKVNVGIPERDVLAVGGLETVDVTFAAVPGRRFEGRRIYLGVEPEDSSRTYRMQLAVDNRDGALRPGMFAKARIVRGKPRQVVMVPLFAVIPRERDKVVFVEEGGLARRRVVETGALLGSRLAEASVEIADGLAAGDRLIIVGHRQVEDGDRVVVGEMPEGLKELMR
jgi:membrane fusion protein (multidrug efflux system)